jgi:hypothetical protein
MAGALAPATNMRYSTKKFTKRLESDVMQVGGHKVHSRHNCRGKSTMYREPPLGIKVATISACLDNSRMRPIKSINHLIGGDGLCLAMLVGDNNLAILLNMQNIG